jgi:hypothetical protein
MTDQDVVASQISRICEDIHEIKSSISEIGKRCETRGTQCFLEREQLKTKVGLIEKLVMAIVSVAGVVAVTYLFASYITK